MGEFSFLIFLKGRQRIDWGDVCRNEEEKKVIGNGVPYGIRTRVAAVKGRCPRPLDEGDSFSSMYALRGRKSRKYC